LTPHALRFAPLGSGSRGNSLLVEFGDTLLMIDCGLPRKAMEARLGQLGRDPADVTAVLVTHEHSDHSQGVARFVRRYGTPTHSTAGTARAVPELGRVHCLNSHRELKIGSIDVRPYPVPHDAREPCQFVFSAGGRRLGLLTDAGHVTAHMRECLGRCDALALEFNHDPDELRASDYPPSVKARIASRYGHLSNVQSAELLRGIAHSGLQWVAGLHLSERNNSAELVGAAFDAAMAETAPECSLHIAAQHEPGEWLEIL
jgi:phosphoribosyl 1,2-cyclic phosphodiesterase